MKTALEMPKAPAVRPEMNMIEFVNIIKDVKILNKSSISEYTISYSGQNKAVEKSVRKWIKLYAEFGKVRYNEKNDQTHIMFKVGK